MSGVTEFTGALKLLSALYSNTCSKRFFWSVEFYSSRYPTSITYGEKTNLVESGRASEDSYFESPMVASLSLYETYSALWYDWALSLVLLIHFI